MSKIYTFNKTVRGHLHVMNEFPCEDSSASFSDENGRYYIAVVADGHGSKSCFRSEFGSKAAAETAVSCLQQFAESAMVSEETEDRFYKDILSNPRYRQMTIRRLTDTIIAGWHDRVLADYTSNPPTIEEMGESASEYENGKNILHIYGTTLIAALKMRECLILLHQGDGRCDVFYSDGSVDQPIPWDKRCEDTATTSLCDSDAAEAFRSCVVNLNEHQVTACLLGSDGVEDAYRDTYESLGGTHVLMGGVHTYYKDLLCLIAKTELQLFEESLGAMLEDFSANGKFSRSGSGDDVSVAGIVDTEAIQQYVARYALEVQRYSLEEDLFWKEDELRGKTRKHGILLKRLKDARLAYNAAVSKKVATEERLHQLMAEREELSAEVERAKKDLDEYRLESQSAAEQFEGKYSRFATAVQRFFDDISSGYSQKENSYRKSLDKLLEYDEQIKVTEEALNDAINSLEDFKEKLTEAQSAFEEYDEKYQAIATEKARIESEIASLPD